MGRAGVLITQLLNNSITNNLSGLEWAAGIPGTIGGAIRGNSALWRRDKNVIKEVISLDISGSRPKVIRRNNRDCEFGYRLSIFKKRPEIIIEATFVLKKGEKKLIETIIKKY